jgi:hypothetical protein
MNPATLAFIAGVATAIVPAHAESGPVPPACDNYDVGLTLRIQFAQRSPKDYGSVMMETAVRELSRAGAVRTCSAELVLNRSWFKSPHVYAEWTVTATDSTHFSVMLTRMTDL